MQTRLLETALMLIGFAIFRCLYLGDGFGAVILIAALLYIRSYIHDRSFDE